MNQENNVSHTNNKKTSENDNIKSTPINSNDQSTPLQQYRDISDHAHKQIGSIYSVFKLVLTIGSFMLAIAIGSGTYFTIHSIKDFKNDISDLKTEIRDDVSNLKTEIHDTVKTLKTEVETSVNRELDEDSIKSIIAEKITDKLITEKISPKIKETEKTLKALSEQLDKAKDGSTKLNELNNFTLTFLKAIGDDYKAFVQLENWSNDSSFAFSEISFRMYQTIRIIHYQQKQISISFIKFPDEIALSKMPFSEFQTFISQQDPIFHADIIKIISERSDIEQIEKTPFLIEVLNKSNSLLARNSAGTLFERAYKDFRWVPFNIDAVNTKWKEIQKTTKQ